MGKREQWRRRVGLLDTHLSNNERQMARGWDAVGCIRMVDVRVVCVFGRLLFIRF